MVEWISSEKNGRLERIDAENRIVFSEFGKHTADVLNVIPPQKAGSLAYLIGLTDASGWCPVDLASFESTIVPSIHVIGDACIATPMPKSAFAANAQAKLCALAVLDLLHGRQPEAAPMINHCYSFLDPDHAISVTGVYEYSAKEKQLLATASAETSLHADWRLEARQARDWQKLLARDVFG
jgi:sulfide dehydrogenase [flavocytochrome c] flavoprotein subunit